MYLLHIEYRISSIFQGRLTIFRKAILKPFLLGRELRLVKKLLPTFSFDGFTLINFSLLVLRILGNLLAAGEKRLTTSWWYRPSMTSSN